MWLDDTVRERARAIEFTLTPSGPLFDGTRSQVLVREAVLGYPASEDGLKDLPLGTYSLRAVMLGKDGRRTPLGIATVSENTFQANVPLVWSPSRVCGSGTSSGVDPFLVRLEPLR
ncbi:hypothetical protein C7B77_10915 [Chamaesiphon polymorphus CCALA 037]|uniref:Uncharacterized protein n=2 Tax=Chamaesiphon TaxID=217161 RepID=A0A2T1GGE2_9CYAN|nr:hypothetical protein C7B77_10915 [Chamaesiphon polymorphus CCALA 037]